jgi:hypothetical protein
VERDVRAVLLNPPIDRKAAQSAFVRLGYLDIGYRVAVGQPQDEIVSGLSFFPFG